MADVKITTSFTTIDGFRERKTFKTVKGAKAYAKKRMGDNFDIGSFYAVDMYGTGKLMCDGISLYDLLDAVDDRFNDRFDDTNAEYRPVIDPRFPTAGVRRVTWGS